MSRKRTHRKYQPGMHPLDLLAACRPMSARQVQGCMLRIHDAFAQLRGGGADQDLFDRIAVVINVGLIRSEQIGQQGVELFQAAQKALMEAARIRCDHGRFGFTGPGLETLKEAIALYEEILAASSPRQMNLAQDEVLRRIRMGEVYCPEALAVDTNTNRMAA
ncbi:hypothetical protein GCM10028796_17220 [Ramlibacter monticola]|uniref:Uncharacterized protein n=1 Tax=Ramlibacter monticola TaxID=1926872 RepID=A0A936YVN4_9BURK|nr:hypothetical protein [Ramlibacter monticola]MBL0390548.1 hypothetical protein [Ramlibacter monticola]